MKILFSVVGRGLIGALVAGVLTFASVVIARHDDMLKQTGDVQSFAWLGAEILSAGAAICGFVLGGIYGGARICKAPLLKVLGSSLIGFVLVGVVAAAIAIHMRTLDPSTAGANRWTDADVMWVSLNGALFGFAVGSVCGIVRFGHPAASRSATDQKP